jgi:hypothetical protein
VAWVVLTVTTYSMMQFGICIMIVNDAIRNSIKTFEPPHGALTGRRACAGAGALPYW